MAQTVQQIREAWAKAQAGILDEAFKVSLDGGSSVDLSMSGGVKAALGDQYDKTERKVRHDAAQKARMDLKAQYIVAEAQSADLIEKRVQEVERLLAPSGASPELLLQASQTSEEQLRTFAEVSAQSGNHEALKAAFSVARQRDIDSIIAYIMDVDQEISDLFLELSYAQALPDRGDAGSYFEQLAEDIPSPFEMGTGLNTSHGPYGVRRNT